MIDLTRAGLTESESKVYLALLDLGPSLAGQIARKAGLHRRTVYDTTEMLINKGLIGYILQNNRRLFQAENPNRILKILQEKQDILTPMISELQIKYSKTNEKKETNFYKGKEGLKTVFEDQLNEKEILILGANENASDVLQYYFKWYNEKRVARKIKTRIIARSRKFSKMKNAEIRYLPGKYASPLAINIYGDKTAIILWASQPLAIVIKNREISEEYKNYFELIWKMAKE
ncbi:MAG: hypothetical protein NUV97_04400 [archaeon]|nr:hypothetical protein [archaeon]MCR4323384.1 hypothetical protein [Nanoarchaeota archaeon]